MIKVTNEKLNFLMQQQGLLHKLQGQSHGDNKTNYRLMKIVRKAGQIYEAAAKAENDRWNAVLEEKGVLEVDKSRIKQRKVSKEMKNPYPVKARTQEGQEVAFPPNTIFIVEQDENDLTPEQEKELRELSKQGREAFEKTEQILEMDPIPMDIILNSKIEFTGGELNALEALCSEKREGEWVEPVKDNVTHLKGAKG